MFHYIWSISSIIVDDIFSIFQNKIVSTATILTKK